MTTGPNRYGKALARSHKRIKRTDANSGTIISHEYGRPEYADCPFGDGTEVDGTGGGWGPPRSDYLRSDALLRDLNEQQIDKP